MVIDTIGNDEDAKPIQVLFGALAMQQWGIRLVPEEERLDLTRYPRSSSSSSQWPGHKVCQTSITMSPMQTT
jgi:hypothetical protein